MKRKLLTILFCSFLILGMVTGCGEQVEDTPKENVEEKSKGKCEVEDCINKIEPKMTLEEVNDLIGFDGEKKDDEENTYVWQLTEKTKITVEFKEKKKASIKATYEKDKITDEKLKVATFYEVVGDVNKKKTYTYEEMVEKFEGVEGHLENKSATSKMYLWVKDGKSFRATFSKSAKWKATIVSLR